MSSTPFNKLRVQPFLGERLVTISWEAADEFNDAKYFIARSPSGAPRTWVQLNPDNPVTNGLDHFTDTNALIPNPGETVYYKIRMVQEGREPINSNPVELFSVLPRHEYGIVAAHINAEWLGMRLAGGVPAWHCIPLSSGDPASGLDPETGLITNAPCGDSYGLPFAGGFATPLGTRVRVISTGPVSETDNAQQLGTDRSFQFKLRLMAFPRPRRGHMIVCPGDQRFIIGETAEPYLFKGFVPLAWEVSAETLDPADLRYKFPVDPYPDDATAYRL